MKKALLSVLIVLLAFSLAFTQDNIFQFKTTPIVGYPDGSDDVDVNLPGYRNAYGVAVAGDGMVWNATYSSRYWKPDGVNNFYPDLITFVATRDTGGVVWLDTVNVYNKPLWIWNPDDGSVDTLRFINMPDGSIDTLSLGNRGMATDHNGDIVIADNSGNLYKINHLTHEGIAKWAMGTNAARPACDAQGFTYHAGLFGGTVNILDPDDWSSPYNTIPDVAPGVSRCMEVSPDGKHVFVARSGGGLLHYYSADGVDGTYAIADTILKAWANQGFVAWDPRGILWFGQREEDPPFKVVGLDPDQDWAIVDSVSFTMWAASPKTDTTSLNYPQPQYIRAVRDAAFNADGSRMYLADYYGFTLKEFELVPNPETGIGEISKEVPGSFTLYNNYPNPFNPTTIIPFDLPQSAHVKLKVYDALGREVGIFIDGQMDAGSHQYEFNGANLATGTYYFKLTVDTKVATGRMMLIK